VEPGCQDRSKRKEYLVIQLRAAADLAAERRAMRHCVASYVAVHCRPRLDLVAAARRRQYRAAFDDRARPPISGDPGAGIRQPHDTS
jgi:hypothetical protein